jgi:hypothetical protein
LARAHISDAQNTATDVSSFARSCNAISRSLVVCGEPSLPCKAGEFIEAYFGQTDDVLSATVENDRFALAVCRFVVGLQLEKKDHFLGSATELLDELNKRAGIYPNDTKIPKDWPKNPGAMSGRLKRFAPALRSRGVQVEWSRAGPGDRLIKLWLTPTKPDDAPTRPKDNLVGGKPGCCEADRRTDAPTTNLPLYSVEGCGYSIGCY